MSNAKSQNELTTKDRITLGLGGLFFTSFILGFSIGMIIQDVANLSVIDKIFQGIALPAITGSEVFNFIMLSKRLKEDDNEAWLSERFRDIRSELHYHIEYTFENPNKLMPIMFFVFGFGFFVWQAGPVLEPFFTDANHKIGANELQQLLFGIGGLCVAIYGYTKRWHL